MYLIVHPHSLIQALDGNKCSLIQKKTTEGFSVIELKEGNTAEERGIEGHTENCCHKWLFLSLPACRGRTFQGKETYIMVCWRAILGMDYVPEPQREQPFIIGVINAAERPCHSFEQKPKHGSPACMPAESDFLFHMYTC